MARNDYQKMASTFLDMWQERLTDSLNNQDVIHQMLDSMQRMHQESAFAYNDAQQSKHRNASSTSHADDDELRMLKERLADCERRIKELEAAAKPKTTRKKPAAKTTKTSTKRKPATKRASAAGTTARSKPKPAAKTSARKTVRKAVKRKK